MPKKKQQIAKEEALSSHRPPQSDAQTPDSLTEPVYHGLLVRRLIQNPHALRSNDVIHLQRAYGNRAVGSLITRPRPSGVAQPGGLLPHSARLGSGQVQAQRLAVPAVQRLMTATEFEQKTKLFARKGKSGAFFADIVTKLHSYEGLQQRPVSPVVKQSHLQSLLDTVNTWLYSEQSAGSSRKQAVKALQIQLLDEAEHLQAASPAAGSMVESGLDQDRNLSPGYVRGLGQMGKQTDLQELGEYRATDLAEYKKFEEHFFKFCHTYQLEKNPAIPAEIWSSLYRGIFSGSMQVKELPKVTGEDRLDKGRGYLGITGPEGQVLRMKLLDEAMQGLNVFIRHAEKQLARAVKTVLAKGGKPTWCFWSGSGAQKLARENNQDGIVLEGSVGSWFDAWNFKTLSLSKEDMGGRDIHLWTALSEMYARQAALNYEKFRFKGYVGKGAIMEQNVFNKIEQPTYIAILDNQLQVPPPQIDWYVVAFDPKKGQWGDIIWEEQRGGEPGTIAHSTDRQTALAEVTKLYHPGK